MMTALNRLLAKCDQIIDGRVLSNVEADIAAIPDKPDWRLDACRKALGDPKALALECGRLLKLSPPYNIRRYGTKLYYSRTVTLNDLDVAIFEEYASAMHECKRLASQGELAALMRFPIEGGGT